MENADGQLPIQDHKENNAGELDDVYFTAPFCLRPYDVPAQ